MSRFTVKRGYHPHRSVLSSMYMCGNLPLLQGVLHTTPFGERLVRISLPNQNCKFTWGSIVYPVVQESRWPNLIHCVSVMCL